MSERYYYERISDDLDPAPPFEEGWLVAASDYDALAVRLAEAEQALRRLVYGHDRRWFVGLIGDSDVTDIVGSVLAADSAKETP